MTLLASLPAAAQAAIHAASDPPGDAVVPVFITREYSLWFLIGQSLAIALGMCMCYSGCYFLCCREWWCQCEAFRRFQYF